MNSLYRDCLNQKILILKGKEKISLKIDFVGNNKKWSLKTYDDYRNKK